MSEIPKDSNSLVEWLPKVLIGIAILLLIYFTQVTYRFKGTYDDSFLAEDNLGLIRGPLANSDYYRMGELDYRGKDPFEDALPADVSMPAVTPDVEIPIDIQTKPATEPGLP